MNGKLCLKSISKSATNLDFPGSTSKKIAMGRKRKKWRKGKEKGKNYNSLRLELVINQR